MQYFILAHDGSDAEAPARRLAARPAHLELAKKHKEEGSLICGGAILDDKQNRVGSAMMLDFESRKALDAWLAVEPYVVGKVWQKIEIREFRIPPFLLEA